MEPSQFLLLRAVDRKPGCAQVLLADALGYDKTTLSRSLRLMEQNGWLRAEKARDLRERGYRLTAAGKKALAATEPKWRLAQERMRGAMSLEERVLVLRAFDVIGRVASFH